MDNTGSGPGHRLDVERALVAHLEGSPASCVALLHGTHKLRTGE
jgi:hypothetical protein